MKTVLITGASRGIGRQIAIDLARKGYNIAMTYNNSEQKAQQLKDEYSNVSIYKCDVSDFEQVENLYRMLEKDFNTIDMVVNNAGISFYGLLQDMTQQEILNVISTNLNGVIYSCRKAATLMLKNHSGKIVNISSIWGINGASCESVYSASKGGVIAFTKALAQELAPSNITVNCVCPGVIKTDMLAHLNPQEIEQLESETPIGTIGTPKDISKAVLFLLSEDANFITGQNIVVDGGFSL